MIKKILLGLVAVIAIVCIIAAFRPEDMNVTRSTTTTASPEAVFKIVNDFRQWDSWSPWSRMDPTMKKTLEGPPEGVGAVYRWNGNSEVGEGSMKVIESRPNAKVGVTLEFVRPFAGKNDVQFIFTPEGSGTKITWAMQSKMPFIGKIAGLFMDCEKMCGDIFNAGLANLKKLAEAAPKA